MSDVLRGLAGEGGSEARHKGRYVAGLIEGHVVEGATHVQEPWRKYTSE